MRGAPIRLLFVVGVLLAGQHAPAMAHGEHGLDQGLHVTGIAVTQGDAGTGSGLAPGHAGDLLHHHHCPIAVDAGNADALPMPAAACAKPWPGMTQALSSRVVAPPLDPPNA